MKTRYLLAAGLGIWIFIGLPVFLVGSFWNGSFDPIPSAPPYLSDADRSVSANLSWLVAVMLAYLPLWIVPLAIARWCYTKRRTRSRK